MTAPNPAAALGAKAVSVAGRNKLPRGSKTGFLSVSFVSLISLRFEFPYYFCKQFLQSLCYSL